MLTLACAVLNEITSGGATLNDSYLHCSLSTVPFGGVGDSGWGAYRGRASFDVWTHMRTVAEGPNWADRLLRVRYMPYDLAQLRMFQRMVSRNPNFGRDGKLNNPGIFYWASRLLGLGAQGPTGAFLRWLLVIVLGWAAFLRKNHA
jgi:beta-apo-4'-carotenal oxygenase